MSCDDRHASSSLALLAASEVGHVSVCRDCGSIHVALPGMTLRLHPRAYLEVAHMVLAARDRLLRLAAGPGAETAPAPPDTQELVGHCGKEVIH
jgi:hypothetical protein